MRIITFVLMNEKIESGGQLYSGEYSLKSIRKRYGFTQSYICSILKVTQTYYSLVENGKRSASIDFMTRLGAIYGLPVAVLVWGSITPESVRKDRKAVFEELKPVLDRLIEGIYF